jgi:hypothetical protein
MLLIFLSSRVSAGDSWDGSVHLWRTGRIYSLRFFLFGQMPCVLSQCFAGTDLVALLIETNQDLSKKGCRKGNTNRSKNGKRKYVVPVPLKMQQAAKTKLIFIRITEVCQCFV